MSVIFLIGIYIGGLFRMSNFSNKYFVIVKVHRGIRTEFKETWTREDEYVIDFSNVGEHHCRFRTS